MEFDNPTGMHALFLGRGGVRAGWRAALYLALFFLPLLLLQELAALAHIRILLPEALSPGTLFVGEAAQAVCAIAAALVMARMEERPFGDYGMAWRSAFRGYFWQGALWGIGEITLLVLVIRALGGYSFGGWGLGRGQAVEYALSWGLVFLTVGVYEEFFFRGYLQFTVASGMGFWPAAVLLSAAFGAVHLGNPGEGLVGALGVFLIGMFFCLTLRRTGNLWFAIGSHAAFDFGETYLYSVPDSGLVLPGHLSAASLHGPRWLTGGSIGPEGSVVSFAILALMFVLFNFFYPPRKSRSSPEAQTIPQPHE
jgi:membrane protease YdiL (CAAX protease family)